MNEAEQDRRKPDNMNRFLAPAFAALLGSSPATIISFEMFNELTKQTAKNETELVARGRWMQRFEVLNDGQNQLIADVSRRIERLEYMQEQLEKTRTSRIN